jgi:hypothetical protein
MNLKHLTYENYHPRSGSCHHETAHLSYLPRLQL